MLFHFNTSVLIHLIPDSIIWQKHANKYLLVTRKSPVLYFSEVLPGNAAGVGHPTSTIALLVGWPTPSPSVSLYTATKQQVLDPGLGQLTVAHANHITG